MTLTSRFSMLFRTAAAGVRTAMSRIAVIVPLAVIRMSGILMTLPARLGVLFRTAASRALGVRTALSRAFVGLSAMRRLSAVRMPTALATNLGHVFAV